MTIYFAGSITGGRVICLYRPSPGRRISGMIAGCAGITVHRYDDVRELPAILRLSLTLVPDP